MISHLQALQRWLAGLSFLAPVISILAALLVFFALVAPNEYGDLTPGVFVRIPVEGLLVVALVLLLPARPRRLVAAVVGVLLGLLTILKMLDVGFSAALDRPFNLVLDWSLFDDATNFLTDSVGRVGAIGAVIGVVLLVTAALVLISLSVLRLTGLVVRHKTTAARVLLVVAAAWAGGALLGVQIVPGIPVASSSEATLVYDSGMQVRAGLQDKQVFAAQQAVDAFAGTPNDKLLTALRGKDVIFTFVESYGRDALENPGFSSGVDAVLDAGTSQLAAAGFAARSAFLTSSTAGGGSWLAHSTFLSGLWIDNQQRYNSLVTGSRLTLTNAFGRAGWRTVGVEPGVTYAWPEGAFYGYDKVYDSHTLGYHGSNFSWSTMPDQYTLAEFQRTEYSTPNRGPLLAEITLTSSHSPWAPIPRMIDWANVGDGSIFGPMAKTGRQPDLVRNDPAVFRAGYAESIEYSLHSLISFVTTYGNDNLVLVFLGDHQPAPIVTGAGASRDVPVVIVAHDPAVLDRISGWGWQDGLRPSPQAPVWRMDGFRNRFLTAFGPASQPRQAQPSGAQPSGALPSQGQPSQSPSAASH